MERQQGNAHEINTPSTATLHEILVALSFALGGAFAGLLRMRRGPTSTV